MTETMKTLLFVLGAVCAAGAAWISRPTTIGVAPPEVIGQPLFADFDDPDQAQRMEIVEYDEGMGEISSFEVARKNGAWVIPSHHDYPADAKENLEKAATMFVGLEVVNVVSDKKKEHATYGVVKPDPEGTLLGDEGVGKLVTMKDDQGRTLAQLIIGEPVQGSEGQHYVRAGSIDRVYTVAIDPDAMSIQFGDWIEGDVLDLNAMDIREMTIRDYSSSPEMTRQGIALNEQQRLDMTVAWNAEEMRWDLKELLELRGAQLRPTELLNSEQLDKDVLDTMKNTLDDLKIVDVERKPAGLGAGLKAEKTFWDDEAGIRSLFAHGFFPVQLANGATELHSSDGEVIVSTKEAVKYLFRFGKVAGIETRADQSKLNRFAMITAELDDSAFEKPVLEGTEDEPSADPSADEGAKKEDATAADTETDSDADDAGRAERLKEFEQRMDDYNEQIEQAKSRVKDLNYRFADWYYVISEDEYKKIRLRRSDIVTVKETSVEEGTGMDALRKLESGGLKKVESLQPAKPSDQR